MSDNSEILIIQYLRWTVQRMEVLPFTRKKLHQWKREISGMLKSSPRVYMKCGISWPLVS